MESGRGSGRTTRMLKEAIDLALSGRAVYVLCCDQRMHVRDIYKRLSSELRLSKELPIKFETWESLGQSNVDLKNNRLMSAHPNCVLLVDHNFYAKHFAFVLQGYHRYDNEYSRHERGVSTAVSFPEMDWSRK